MIVHACQIAPTLISSDFYEASSNHDSENKPTKPTCLQRQTKDVLLNLKGSTFLPLANERQTLFHKLNTVASPHLKGVASLKAGVSLQSSVLTYKDSRWPLILGI